MAYKAIVAKYDGKCKGCGGAIIAGDGIIWESLHKSTYHPECKPVVTPKAPKSLGQSVAELAAKGMPIVGGIPSTPSPVPGTVNPYKHASPGHASPVPVAKDPEPQTQKGKGIITLQKAGILGGEMAIVCTTLDRAIWAFGKIPGRKFARPCPINARHGFVDSREVKSEGDVIGIWGETKAADPQGELILMPLVQAEFNCVWRPGLLAIGPGHDGATAGHDSVSVFLQETYAPAWQELATAAGVDLATKAPFIEAVSHKGVDTVITQIRSGVKDAPTEPDWVPEPMTVGEVIAIDGAVKATPDEMLAWEHKATTLTKGYHIVHDEGGNLGDHWSMHCQLNGIAVVTSFTPQVGQVLPKMGQDLTPLEPQAIIWGFLGGLLSPSLKEGSETGRRQRTRATVAAILGTHHGLRMGGQAGEHLGASVALFLRLGQAAVWGESRHAYSYGASEGLKGIVEPLVKGQSRQQVFAGVLDDWRTGRAGLRAVTRCFHEGHWSSAMGGKNWAAISHAVVALDGAMIELVRIPSRVNAKKVLAKLTTAVNLAHNGAQTCFLNKFCGSDWFDMAAALDPRAACFAGPVWYQATLADPGARMGMLASVESLSPITVGYAAPKGNVLVVKDLTKVGAKLKGVKATPFASILGIPNPESGSGGGYYHKIHTGKGKVGSFGTLEVGDALVNAPGAPVKAQAKGESGTLHVQIEMGSGGYISGTVSLNVGNVAEVMEGVQAGEQVESMGGSGVPYRALTVEPGAIKAGAIVILTTTV